MICVVTLQCTCLGGAQREEGSGDQGNFEVQEETVEELRGRRVGDKHRCGWAPCCKDCIDLAVCSRLDSSHDVLRVLHSNAILVFLAGAFTLILTHENVPTTVPWHHECIYCSHASDGTILL